MQKILLIGNGPSAMSRKIGREIDSFSLVARFNNFIIKGFEEYIGTKTDYWITCLPHPHWYKEYQKVFLSNYNRKPDSKFLLNLREKYPDAQHFPEWAWRETLEDMGYSAPSSGAVAATYFSRDYETYIYGFDFFADQKHHYGDNVEAGTNHKAKFEFEYFRKLIVAGRVIPFHSYLADLNYKILHNIYPGYGVGGNWFKQEITDIASEHDVKTILDYGCGKGSLVKLLSKEFTAYGYDPYVTEYSTVPVDSVEMIVSTDFLEHVEEKELGKIFTDINSLKPKVQFHAISNRKAAQILPDGRNAHQNIKSAEWWEKKLETLGKVTCLGHNDTQNFTMYRINNG